MIAAWQFRQAGVRQRQTPMIALRIRHRRKPTFFMGAKLSFHSMSNLQLQAHIRRTAQDSARVVIASHALARMEQRSVIDWEVYACLKMGIIERPPRRDRLRGTLKCTMEHFGSGRNLAVAVALDDADPDLVVVTVMTRRT